LFERDLISEAIRLCAYPGTLRITICEAASGSTFLDFIRNKKLTLTVVENDTFM
jgi:hypothetical protein